VWRRRGNSTLKVGGARRFARARRKSRRFFHAENNKTSSRLSYTAPHDGVRVAHPGASRGMPPYAQCLVETGEGLVEAALAVRPPARLIARFGFDILSV
jgi:hypothetical protein